MIESDANLAVLGLVEDLKDLMGISKVVCVLPVSKVKLIEFSISRWTCGTVGYG